MRGPLSSLWLVGLAVAIFSAVLISIPNHVLAVGGEGEGWPSFNESDGCGTPWIRGPKVEATGSLDLTAGNSTLIRGPVGNFFGRTARDIYFSRMWWDVPMSDHESLSVHQRMAPAIDALNINLAAAQDEGLNYDIFGDYTSSYNNRTVGGQFRVSQHGLANAIDINSNTNPYSGSNILTTNMPAWFVAAWTDAGFCWGGDWEEVKDPMHFNWRGPLFTSGISRLPASAPPLTEPDAFVRLMDSVSVPGTLENITARLLMDADGDGAIDIVNISESESIQTIDVLSANEGYSGCAVTRHVTPPGSPYVTVVHGDWNRDGAQDIWRVDDSSGITVTAMINHGGFQSTESTSVATTAGDAYLAADHNVDGWTDLYVLRHEGSMWSVDIFNGADRFATTLATGDIAGPASMNFTAVDRNLDHVPDLFGITTGQSVIADGASGFVIAEAITGISGTFDDVAGTDFDGDGRHDLVTLTEDRLDVYAGNSALPGVVVTSWFEWPAYECGSNGFVYPYEGRFGDDDDSIFESDIEWLAALGITKGCNPPGSDRYCPTESVTRGQMAAFLDRALGLPPAGTDFFTDDDDSTFEDNINRVAAAGITLGCEPGMYCPDNTVTRGQMAAFMSRALGLAAQLDDPFIDDDGSVFEDDIEKIAAAGITLGCGDSFYCPHEDVTRGQMAAFLHRALS